MPVRLLITNACGQIEGDAHMLLLSLEHFSPDLFEIYAATVPRGRVFETLESMKHVRVIPVELGGTEALPARGSNVVLRKAQFLTGLARTVEVVRRCRIDVLYTIDRTVAAHQAAFVSHLTGKPFVLASVFPHYPQHSRLNRRVVRQARRIHVHSEYLRSYIQPYAAHPDRIQTITLAIQTERYHPEASGDAVRRDLGIPPSAPMVLLAGRLSPYKGQEDLLKAARIVLAQRPDTHFVLAGHDTKEAVQTHGPHAVSFRAILDRQIAEMGLCDRVQLVGYYPDLPDLIAACDIATMPSHEEPFGLVALEGMAMAKPVVATRAGGVPEFVIDGEVGLLVPPRDPPALAAALLQLINHPDRAREMGRQGRRRVEQFHTARHYTDRVSQLILDALNT